MRHGMKAVPAYLRPIWVTSYVDDRDHAVTDEEMVAGVKSMSIVRSPHLLIAKADDMAKTPLSLPFSGPRLREWRERAGLTQQQLAEKCGLSRFQISRWELGTAKPLPSALAHLTHGLGTALGRPRDGVDRFTLDELLDARMRSRM